MSTISFNQTGNLLAAQQPASNPTINSGNQSGRVFDGLGDDFLDPDKILKDVDRFSGSVKPTTSNTWTSQLVPNMSFDRYADSGHILQSTNNSINNIMSAGFGQNLNFNVPLLPGGIPDLGANPDPTRIALSTLFFSNGLQAPSGFNDPNSYNPYLWQNPNSNNILLGIQQAQNNIFSAPVPPAYNPFLNSFSLLG